MKTKKRKVKSPTTKAQDKLWKLCKELTRLRYGNVCFTCGRAGLTGSNWHTGHVPWPKATLQANLKYDLRILRPQCYNCNINHSGLGGVAYSKMLKEFGKEYMDDLEKEKNYPLPLEFKALDHYTRLIDEYEKLLTDYSIQYKYNNV